MRQRDVKGGGVAPLQSFQVTALFELGWRGGVTETRLHRRRPGIDALPWSTLDLAHHTEPDMLEARRVWSNGVFTEYASAAAFSSLATAMLRCGAPVDLIAMAADVVVDELFHVELSSRLTMELGGAMPIEFDVDDIAPVTTPGIRPLMRAAEIAITTSCVGEALSIPALARSRALATEPLVRAVLDRLLADEGPHAKCGLWFFDWAADQLTDDERAHLARLAEATIETYAPLWQGDDVLGLHDAAGARAMRDAVDTAIATPLARYGIAIERAALHLGVASSASDRRSDRVLVRRDGARRLHAHGLWRHSVRRR